VLVYRKASRHIAHACPQRRSGGENTSKCFLLLKRWIGLMMSLCTNLTAEGAEPLKCISRFEFLVCFYFPFQNWAAQNQPPTWLMIDVY
jgi:hypothetical protein